MLTRFTSHVNIKTAFLETKLDKEIWLALPTGLRIDIGARKIVVDIDARAGDVLRLHRSLYGLKQAGLDWYKEFHNMITNVPHIRPSLLSPGIFYGPDVAVLT